MVVEATRRAQRPLRGKDKIGVRVGRILGRSKMGKHFRYEITADAFTCERDDESVAQEAALDGIYVLRTSVSAEELGSAAVVEAYKRLARIEQAFRISKDFALEVEPIRHRREDRVHVFLCMLALYVRLHMEHDLAPILFTDHDTAGATARNASVVAPAARSPAAEEKVRRKRTTDGLPVQSFRSLMTSLATLTKNTVRMGNTPVEFEQYAEPTPLQARAFALLDISYRMARRGGRGVDAVIDRSELAVAQSGFALRLPLL